MPFEITIDASAVQAALDGMQNDLNNFPHDMAHELTAWQIEDMHRGSRFVNTRLQNTTAETRIFRSGDGTAQPKTGVRTARRRMRERRGNSTKTIATSRPILRPVLFDRLCERMQALLKGKLSWQ